MRYAVLIDGEAGGYGVAFPDLPGCVAMGATVEEALANAAEAARDYALTVEEAGGTVPAPSRVDTLRADPEVVEALAAGAALGTVPLVRQTGRPVRANITLDAGTLEAIDAEADRRGVTRSGLIGMIARLALPQLG